MPIIAFLRRPALRGVGIGLACAVVSWLLVNLSFIRGVEELTRRQDVAMPVFHKRFQGALPRLTADNYRETSPAGWGYNCIAWAANVPDTWWWPTPALPACGRARGGVGHRVLRDLLPDSQRKGWRRGHRRAKIRGLV